MLVCRKHGILNRRVHGRDHAMAERSDQGGPVAASAGVGWHGAGNAANVMTARSGSRIGSTRSLMSLKGMAMLPSWRMIKGLSSRHSGWHGRMPRSRQISAMTAPAGRRDLGRDLRLR